MPIFLLTLLKNVNTYIYLVLLTIIGTLSVQAYFAEKKIDSLKEDLQTTLEQKVDLENKVNRQNAQVKVLQEETEKLKTRVSDQELVIEFLDEKGQRVIMSLDEQSIPKEHRGALMWLIQKSKEELAK